MKKEAQEIRTILSSLARDEESARGREIHAVVTFQEVDVKKLLPTIIAHLSSLTFTVILLAALSVTISITIMEHEISAIIQRHQLWQGAALKYIISLFGFNDLYNSIWFKSLLILFYLNLLLCTVKRIPWTLKTLGLFNHKTDHQIPARPSLKETFILHCHQSGFHRTAAVVTLCKNI